MRSAGGPLASAAEMIESSSSIAAWTRAAGVMLPLPLVGEAWRGPVRSGTWERALAHPQTPPQAGAGLPSGIVRSLSGYRHAVDVAFRQTGIGDANEPRAGA